MADIDNQKYVELLEKELNETYISQIQDAHTATTDDLLRDMHRMLVGNGGPQKGLLFKNAATKATLTIMGQDINKMEIALNDQVENCKKIQSNKVITELNKESNYYKLIVKTMWKYKGYIAFILLCGFLYINNHYISSRSAVNASNIASINTNASEVAKIATATKIEQSHIEKIINDRLDAIDKNLIKRLDDITIQISKTSTNSIVH